MLETTSKRAVGLRRYSWPPQLPVRFPGGSGGVGSAEGLCPKTILRLRTLPIVVS